MGPFGWNPVVIPAYRGVTGRSGWSVVSVGREDRAGRRFIPCHDAVIIPVRPGCVRAAFALGRDHADKDSKRHSSLATFDVLSGSLQYFPRAGTCRSVRGVASGTADTIRAHFSGPRRQRLRRFWKSSVGGESTPEGTLDGIVVSFPDQHTGLPPSGALGLFRPVAAFGSASGRPTALAAKSDRPVRRYMFCHNSVTIPASAGMHQVVVPAPAAGTQPILRYGGPDGQRFSRSWTRMWLRQLVNRRLRASDAREDSSGAPEAQISGHQAGIWGASETDLLWRTRPGDCCPVA